MKCNSPFWSLRASCRSRNGRWASSSFRCSRLTSSDSHMLSVSKRVSPSVDFIAMPVLSPRYSARNGMAMKSTLGETRFETDNRWESEEVKREHRKVLDAHLPFRDLQLAR